MEWANLTAWHTLDINPLKKQLPAEGTGITYTFHLTASEPLALAQASHQVLSEMR